MRTLRSPKLFFFPPLHYHFSPLNHYILPKWVFIVQFPQPTVNDTTKGEAIADKSAKLPIGLPFCTAAICAGCRVFGDNTAQVAPRSSRLCRLFVAVTVRYLCCLPSDARLQGRESFHLGWRQPAELPVQQMPFSSKTTCCSSPAPYHVDSSITDFKT